MNKTLVCAFGILSSCLTNAQTYTVIDNTVFQSTHLIEIKSESALNRRVKGLRESSFESASGVRIDFYNWYSPAIPEVHTTWLTQINRTFGVLWGLSTGEHSNKYNINPAVRIGIVYHTQITKNDTFSLVASTHLGGELNEHSCVADYGDIGGIREVNCRLAATTLEPEETLNYLERGTPESTIRINLVHQF